MAYLSLALVSSTESDDAAFRLVLNKPKRRLNEKTITPSIERQAQAMQKAKRDAAASAGSSSDFTPLTPSPVSLEAAAHQMVRTGVGLKKAQGSRCAAFSSKHAARGRSRGGATRSPGPAVAGEWPDAMRIVVSRSPPQQQGIGRRAKRSKREGSDDDDDDEEEGEEEEEESEGEEDDDSSSENEEEEAKQQRKPAAEE